MDKMIDRADAYKKKAQELYMENKELKQMLAYCKKEIEKRDARIKRLEKSLLSAVTSLGWER